NKAKAGRPAPRWRWSPGGPKDRRMQRLRSVILLPLRLAARSGGTETNGTAATPRTSVNQTAAPAPLPVPPAEAWLPAPGRHAARAMVLAPPAEAVALRDRMVAAIMRNQAWYEAYA